MLNPKPVYDEECSVDWDMFCAMIEDGQKADLIDGVIYMASPDSRRANDVTNFVNMLIYWYNVRKKLGGQVFVNRFAFRLSDHDAPEPDVAFVAKDRLTLVEEGGMRGAPDIAVEVACKESRKRDFETKRSLYEESGVREYWLIDYLAKRVEFLRLRDGRFFEVPLEEGCIFRSEVLPGFWLDANWLLAKPLPDPADCIDQILRG